MRSAIRSLGRAIVAWSGGVDSSLVAFVANQELGHDALAVTSGSASLKRSDLTLARELAASWGLRHRVIETDELQDPLYRSNPSNRCFHCKTSLYTRLKAIARLEDFSAILNGTNADDFGDFRPGLGAAANFGVVSPLANAGFRKVDVRALARRLSLENADKPQAACLSSRVPYGTPVNKPVLAQIEAAEAVLSNLGIGQCRVRHHGDVARLELDPEDVSKALEHREEIDRRVRACGYRYVSLDLGGYRTGSLNDGLTPTRDHGSESNSIG